jgi:kumamolisin
MPTPKVRLEASRRHLPPEARIIGAPQVAEQIEVMVVVRRKTPLPPPGTAPLRMSREQFAEVYGASPADIANVEQFAVSEGLRVVSSSLARRTVVLGGTVAAMQQAFGVELVTVEYEGKQFRARGGYIEIPANLHGVIEAVLGLDNRPQAKPKLRHHPLGIAPRAAGDISYTPLQVAHLYNYPASGNGAGQTIAIIELGGGYRVSDLSSYFSGLGINPAPKVTAVDVDGGKNQPTGDPNSADAEVLLDIEVAGAIAPGASIVVYFTPNTDQGFLDAITTAIHDTANEPSVISISWGGPESSWTQQSMQSYDQAFQDAATLGVTVCVAAGDNGSTDGVSDGQQHVDFPASSPHVLACGGTKLLSNSGAIASETVWNDGPGQGATGGGISEVFTLPAFQSSAGVPVSVNPSHFAGRGVPDVSGDADPVTGYQTLVDGQTGVVGGTSAVAPLWAALVALMNQQIGRSLGYLNPAIYPLSASSGAFNDITSGNNGAYSAGPGWDACTGLGSPNGANLLRALTAPSKGS